MSQELYSVPSASYKNSNATFTNQIRDASDVTAMIRQRGITRSYQLLRNKGLAVQGGIPQTDLIAMAHTVGAYAPANSTMDVSFSECATCPGGNTIPFSMLTVSLSFIRY
jgi:hypothetical protein